MGQIPPFFRKSGDTPIASYSFAELASGTGFAALYLGDTDGPDYSLSLSRFYAKVGYVEAIATDTPDWDFDTSPINFPLVVEGQAIVNLSLLLTNGAAPNPRTMTRTWTMTLRKVSGATETDLVSGQVTISVAVAQGGTSAQNICLPLTVPKTKFKAGDIIRLTVSAGTDSGAGGSSAWTDIATDPAGRTIQANFTYDSSVLFLPIKIDL